MNIYDKARWQIDGGMEEKLVIEHFYFMFNWLDEFNLLSEYGKQIKNSLIDDEIVLTDEMLNHSGQVFLEKFYDKYISSIEYGKKENAEMLEKMYFSL